MKTIKITMVCVFVLLTTLLHAQDTFQNLSVALRADDTVKLAAVINQNNINDCYKETSGWSYCALSEAIRNRAPKCFDWLIDKGADVNKSCDGYVPPLMHAAKYGSLAMVKKLIAKRADKNYHYTGNYGPANGETPASYAEKCGQNEIADYLRSLK
jgi:ankyrin repeat protein